MSVWRAVYIGRPPCGDIKFNRCSHSDGRGRCSKPCAWWVWLRGNSTAYEGLCEYHGRIAASGLSASGEPGT